MCSGFPDRPWFLSRLPRWVFFGQHCICTGSALKVYVLRTGYMHVRGSVHVDLLVATRSRSIATACACTMTYASRGRHRTHTQQLFQLASKTARRGWSSFNFSHGDRRRPWSVRDCQKKENPSSAASCFLCQRIQASLMSWKKCRERRGSIWSPPPPPTCHASAEEDENHYNASLTDSIRLLVAFNRRYFTFDMVRNVGDESGGHTALGVQTNAFESLMSAQAQRCLPTTRSTGAGSLETEKNMTRQPDPSFDPTRNPEHTINFV